MKERVEMCDPFEYIYFLSALFVISCAWLRSLFVYYRQKSIIANKIYLTRAAILLTTYCATSLYSFMFSFKYVLPYWKKKKDANKIFEVHILCTIPTSLCVESFLRKCTSITLFDSHVSRCHLIMWGAKTLLILIPLYHIAPISVQQARKWRLQTDDNNLLIMP